MGSIALLGCGIDGVRQVSTVFSGQYNRQTLRSNPAIASLPNISDFFKPARFVASVAINGFSPIMLDPHSAVATMARWPRAELGGGSGRESNKSCVPLVAFSDSGSVEASPRAHSSVDAAHRKCWDGSHAGGGLQRNKSSMPGATGSQCSKLSLSAIPSFPSIQNSARPCPAKTSLKTVVRCGRGGRFVKIWAWRRRACDTGRNRALRTKEPSNA